VVAVCDTSSGQKIVHPPLLALFTVTLNVQGIDACEASVAVHVTLDVPSGKIDPGGGVQETVTQLPVAVAWV